MVLHLVEGCSSLLFASKATTLGYAQRAPLVPGAPSIP
jgi:hypothetical protein